MATRITAETLKKQDGYVQVEDILCMTHPMTIADDMALARQLKEAGFYQNPPFNNVKELGESSSPFLAIMMIERAYHDYIEYENGEEPSWMPQCPPELRRYLRRTKAIHGLPHEPFAIAHLPFTGLEYVIKDDGITAETVDTFGLFRLDGIKQLGYLQNPSVAQYGTRGYPLGFNHTRFCHILDVRVLAALMAANNDLPRIWRDTLAIAALTHDALTPAGGDTTKLIDPEAFDEDVAYPELLERTDWELLRTKYQINPELLIETVQGKGVLGQILNTADRDAYVSRDLAVCRYKNQTDSAFYRTPTWFRPFNALLDEYPEVCSIWDTVQIDPSGKVYFDDSTRLRAFLCVRVLLFRELYLHPAARFKEFLLSGFLIKLLYESGELTRDMLLSMSDHHLEQFIDAKTGKWNAVHRLDTSETVQYKSFATLDEARRYEQILLQRGVLVMLTENVGHAIKPSTDFLVRAEDGAIRPFHDACSEWASIIEGYARIPDPHRVYWVAAHDDLFDESFIRIIKTAVAARTRD